MSVMAQLNQFHSFHQSSLPNGKIDWEWIEIEEQWAPREQSNEWNELLFSRSQRNHELLFSLLGFSRGDYGLGHQPMLRKEKTNAKKRRAMNEWSWRKEWNETLLLPWIGCLFSHEMKWNEEKQAMEKKMSWMEPNPRSQMLRGKPK